VTDGDAARTQPWVKSLGVEYAYGHDHTFPWVFAYNIWTYPYCLVVAPSGAVVWGGHPEKLKEATIRKHLKTAINKPLFEWPKALDGVREAIRERKFKLALDRARGVAETSPELASYVADVERLIGNRLAGLRAALAAGDYATVIDVGDQVQEELADLPSEMEAAKIARSVFDDPAAVGIWNAQAKLRRMRADLPHTKAEADALIGRFEKLMKAHPKTAVETEARVGVGVLKKIRDHLK